MASETWAEKMKKRDDVSFIQIDEMAVLAVGIIIYLYFQSLLFVFVCTVLILYWFKIRHYERLIVQKKRDIYNVQYDNAQGQTKDFAEGRTAEARRPMEYELDQLETRRKFLVEIFVVVNLILLVLLESQKGAIPAVL